MKYRMPLTVLTLLFAIALSAAQNKQPEVRILVPGEKHARSESSLCPSVLLGSFYSNRELEIGWLHWYQD
jgi:hypothetical protein